MLLGSLLALGLSVHQPGLCLARSVVCLSVDLSVVEGRGPAGEGNVEMKGPDGGFDEIGQRRHHLPISTARIIKERLWHPGRAGGQGANESLKQSGFL